MNFVTMLELRRNATAVIARIQSGEKLVLTHRGKPVVRLEPIDKAPDDLGDDPFYSLCGAASDEDEPPMDNEKIDDLLYG